MHITPQPSLDAPSTKPLKVSFPNLEPETKDAYKKFLKKLNGIYTEKLTFDTNVLIATNVDSEKYRIACIIGIPVVTSQWLVNSFAKEQFLPTENYILPIFKGLMIGVLGFNKDETVELEKIITGGGGEIVTSLDRIMNAKDLQLVLMKNSEIKRYESWILSTAHSRPIVTVDWLKDCLVTKQYLKPNKYAINRWRASDRQSALQKLNETITQFQQIDNLLLKIFNTYEIGDDPFEFLEGTVVYFHNLPAQLEKIQKKLVNAGGGVYVKSIIPEVTHIIADEYNEEELKIFHKHRQTKVVDVFWLRDCILYRRLIKADDYLIHPLPKVIAELNNATLPNKTFADSKSRPTLIRRNTTLSSKTNSLETFKTSGRSISYTEHSTISKNRAGKVGTGKGKEKKTNMTKPIGIFKNINLYFNPEFKGLAKSKKLAAENSANILEDLNVFEKIFYILPDSEESVKMFKQNTNSNIKFVSYRWIDYCLKTKMIVRDIVEKKLIYLFPFSRKVPLADFSNAFIYAAGLNPTDKSVLKKTIEILGAKFVYDPSKLTVLICEDTTSKKYSDIKNKYPEVPIVNRKWFFDSLNQCEMVNTQSYLV